MGYESTVNYFAAGRFRGRVVLWPWEHADDANGRKSFGIEGTWRRPPGHPFYRRLNELLEQAGFDKFCEEHCEKFYHEKLGRPSLVPGMYFRLRQFLQIGLDERTPDHVTLSRTRRLIDEDTHQEVFGWVLRQVTRAGLLKGKTIGIDATTLEANAAMKSIVRRHTEESYIEYLKRLAEAAGLNRTMKQRCGAWIGDEGRRRGMRSG